MFWETTLGKWIFTASVAMTPVLELRGAIPVGTAAGLAPWEAFTAAVIGNFIPVIPIILLVRQIFYWLKRHPRLAPKIRAIERRAHLKGRLVRKYRLAGLVILVAIPLPGTGAWTGALVAALLDIRLNRALPAITLGILIAGLITTALTCGVIALF